MMKAENAATQIKRYVAADMRSGLKMVRDELGPDAVILSSKRVPDGIEILSTLEYHETGEIPEQLAATQASVMQANDREPGQSEEQRPQEQLDSVFEQLLNQHRQQRAADSADQELMAAMRSEIENLRLLLKEQMAHNREERWGARNPAEVSVMKRLNQRGLSRFVAQSVIQKLPEYTTIEESWNAALESLKQRIRVVNDKNFQQGAVALLGPTGAGKTTTMAKLAVRYALRYGRDSLALVTTDCQRLAAFEQLKTLARIIDVPVRIVDEHTNMRKVMHSLRHKAMVFVDTAGMNSSGISGERQLAELEASGVPVRKLLVLPCTSQGRVLEEIYRQTGDYAIDGCVLTKIDERGRIGELLSLLVEKQLPVAYITNGQAIPDDIETASADQLLEIFNESGIPTVEPLPGMLNNAAPEWAASLQY